MQKKLMTPTQVKQEFAAFLLGMRLNLDPGLMAAEAPNLQNFTRGRALLNYNDPALDNTASRYIKEFLPSEEVARERCASAEQAAKIEQAHLNAIALVETYVRRTESIRNGEVRAADIIPPLDLPTNGDSPAIARWFAQQEQMNPNYGYAMMIAGGTLIGGAALAGATGIGSAVAASEASVAAVPALTVIEGGKMLAARAATSNLDKIAASAAGAMTAMGLGSESKASETVVHATPATALPPLSTMNAGTDFMGERGNVNHLSWRFTGYPAGSPENSLENLYRKDIEAGRAQSAAHLVIDEKGQILRNEALCCKWENNPQIHAGNSSNGIGVYVMGDGQLLPSQRTTLGTLDQHFQQQIKQAGQVMGQDTLQPSSLIEREEWQGASQAPAALQAATMRARANLAVPH